MHKNKQFNFFILHTLLQDFRSVTFLPLDPDLCIRMYMKINSIFKAGNLSLTLIILGFCNFRDIYQNWGIEQGNKVDGYESLFYYHTVKFTSAN